MIRIATIGTSVITESFIDAVAQAGADGSIAVAAVTSRTAERARAFADTTGIATASDDLPGLIAAGEVDAVYVGSPNGAHAAQAREAIAAGAHVFVEKPATPTSDEWDALVAEARTAGVVLFEGMRNVYDPGLVAVRELIPQLGVLRRASFAYCQRSARYDLVLAGETPNIFDPALGGGALMDLGVYPLSAMVALFGEPEAVAAVSARIATGVDGTGTALLSYPGMVGEVTFSKITRSDRPSEIQGELGSLEIDHIAQPRHLRLTLLDGTVVERRIDAADNNMRYEVTRFAELIGGADPAPDQQRTGAVLRTLERIRADGRMV
ncbi:Gfo/Idh/MocA family oxidoreductase [Microbacterium sp. W1N]|uniref:Gfo/Idh/MocA family protein n=1 Tax=Microbacterium festucae TaxID=2977531 RepID=UPI0021C13737|nr:Gfo/Idh/MocA family oxidoreductase [Microbacterium festucae]MCT9819528.1 Gfo/Idh/MocA family oxidoreductase [Microbacterium festucae]